MTWIPDEVVGHLADIVAFPELPGRRYEIEAAVGRGGMGTVFRAKDRELSRSVAIKVAHDARDSAAIAARLRREAGIIARLEHPGVVPIHEVGALADGRPFYVMKYVEGGTLAAWRNGGHSRNEALRLFLRLCDTVAQAHARGVVHRDLKPENVMVGPFGEVFVMDWGVARVLDDGEAAAESAPAAIPGTAHGTVLGTPGYMAPEQAREGGTADHRADVHGLGGLLAFLVGGKHPEPGRIPPLPGEPRALRAIVARAMAADPAARYDAASDLGRDVARFLDREPVSAYRENPLERLGRWLGKHQFIVWLVVGYLTLRVLIFFFSRR